MRQLCALCKKITSIKTHLGSYNTLEILLDGVYVCVSVHVNACMCLCIEYVFNFIVFS